MGKIKVLIIDDDEALAQELAEVMRESGYDTGTVSDASSAIKTADEKRPDVILLDLKMPGKSGFQVADDLKHFSTTSDIPIIAMTGYYKERQHKSFMLSLGIVDCVVKPFDPREIVEKIRKYQAQGR